MGKQFEKNASEGYLSAAIVGIFGATLFFGLLLLAAMLGENKPVILANGALTAKACLFFSALLCGVAAGKRAGRKKLLHALTAEGVLLLALMLCALSRGNDIHSTSVLIDLLLLLFGAFAGTGQRRRRKIKQRGKH